MRGLCSEEPWLPTRTRHAPRSPARDVEAGSGPLPEDCGWGSLPVGATPLPEGEREEAQAGKPVRGLSSQEKKGLPPPPGPSFFPPLKGAEKTEDAQEGQKGGCHSRWSPLSCPPVPSVIPAGFSGNPPSEGVRRLRGGRERGPSCSLSPRERAGVRGPCA